MGNFDELFSKTKIVAESLNKKSAKAFDLSRKRVEYLDAKAKIAKFYEKYGRLQFSLSMEEEIDENELDMLTAQITAYREKINSLKAELDESTDKEELKREAEELKKEVISASQEAREAIKKQMDEVCRNAKIAFNKSAGSTSKNAQPPVDVTEVSVEGVSSEEE
ncbi:MAG: hypothetical protein K2L36_05060 [Eubacterium sp.]|nr:hypothetical protein [Eubacterium sp.]